MRQQKVRKRIKLIMGATEYFNKIQYNGNSMINFYFYVSTTL